MRGRSASRTVRGGLLVGFALAGVGLAAAAISSRWHDLPDAAASLHPVAVIAAAAAVLAGLFATLLSWRAVLADLGSALPLRPALRVFFLGQLGKYLPGSVWWLVGQVELAADEGIPRRRAAAAGSLAVLISLVAALALAALTLPLLAVQATARYWPALVIVPPLLAGLHPRVLNRVLDTALRLARRDRLEHPLSGRGLAAALGFAGAAWVAFGTQIAVLTADQGAAGLRATVLCIGAFALAWSVGFLAVVIPAGIGVREAALVAALAPVLPAGRAVVVALVSRVLMSVGDLAWAVGAAASAGRALRSRRSDGVEPV